MPLPPMKEPEALELLRGIASSVPVLTFLSTSLMVVNATQTASLAIKPLAPRAFRRYNRLMANTWWGFCVKSVEMAYGTRVELSGDTVPLKENVVLVANHQQMADITHLMFLALSKQRLGDMKWFAKDEIKYVPFLGWAMVLIDSVFVKRDWTRDRASIEETFAGFLRYDVPMWLMTFPEGTRSSPKKLAQSQAYAREHGRTPLEHVQLPRTKGFVASVAGLRKHLDAVYDVTIGYPNGVPSLWQYARGLSRLAHLHVRRFPIQDLPEDDEALSDWLHDRFAEKDRLLDGFYEKGSFPERAGD